MAYKAVEVIMEVEIDDSIDLEGIVRSALSEYGVYVGNLNAIELEDN